ncbi:hypothetical protein [Cohnella abietis]|uniref:Uncharacterized protein n=1 Tax=Cohnella abietis TaxID=2507935 RepID=A0A3T1D366_9BACL|nr:hypothetical protein [Cohnella abietis]BBI32469.1 hypothetical protein KCTCHS21_18680 [Cohnella abietis]
MTQPNITAVYKLEETGSQTMGFASMERYFLNQKDAVKAFISKIKEYRKSEDLASKKDLDGKKPIKITENPKSFGGHKVIKEAWASVWDSYTIPEEGTEWEIGSLRLQVLEIKLEVSHDPT